MTHSTPHTPGPWTFDHDWDRIPTIIGADRTAVARVEKETFVHGKFPGIGHTEPLSEREANALLLVAAPDLLEALRSVVAIADRKTVEFDRAKAAIAKATGVHGENGDKK